MQFLPARRAPATLLIAGVAALLALSGCGTPGAPQPPSLQLPDRVTDLAAQRNGSQVTLTWKMPRRTTDKINIKAPIPVRVCRQEPPAACHPLAASLSFAPGADATFTDELPAPLASGPPRPVSYFVELPNTRGRSAGLSNPAAILAGQSPDALAGLHAEAHPEGIALHWTSAASEPPATEIRLHRRLLTPPETKPAEGLLAPQPEPLEQNLLIDDPAHPGRAPNRALDRSARLGQSYEYRAQRIVLIELNGQKLELAGPLTDPVRVEAADIFPPATPTGLAAVAISTDTAPSIDLNWQPGTEANLAGYAVYRTEPGGDWQRISPAQPIPSPAFHDTGVQAGHSYIYAVTAIGHNGRESARSPEATETVPQP